jgi:3-deoxy-D-manno-octulosonic-acid transferase
MFLQVLQQHPEYLQQAQWWIVPRHPQRFDEVADLLQASGLPWQRRSQWPADVAHTAVPQEVGLVLGDSLGEMPLYYGAASVALLGGSFAPLGGQNLIELAACGCPVLMGPHTYNFAQASQWAEDCGAAQRVSAMSAAIEAVVAWLAQPTRRAQATRASLSLAQSHQGAAQRTAQALAPWLA